MRLVGMLVIAAALVGCGDAGGPKQEASRNQVRDAAAMQKVTSQDGTVIAFEKVGAGPAVIIVNGALADRKASAEVAKLLAPRFTVYSYDRRGRGDSTGGASRAVGREIEDIAALVQEAGGAAYLVGFSSGAALALEAASALGPKIGKLAIYEPPYDDAAGAADKWRRYRAEQAELLGAGKRGDAVLHHMKFAGVPDAVVAQMKASPAWGAMEAMAPTLPNDVAAIGEDRAPPIARAAKVQAKTLVMDGGASHETMPFMRTSADKIAAAMPNARRRTLDGEAHNVRPQAVAPILIEFLAAP